MKIELYTGAASMDLTTQILTAMVTLGTALLAVFLAFYLNQRANQAAAAFAWRQKYEFNLRHFELCGDTALLIPPEIPLVSSGELEKLSLLANEIVDAIGDDFHANITVPERMVITRKIRSIMVGRPTDQKRLG